MLFLLAFNALPCAALGNKNLKKKNSTFEKELYIKGKGRFDRKKSVPTESYNLNQL